MQTITATTPSFPPPTWAILERKLIDLMNSATDSFLARYVNADGELIWRAGAPARAMVPMISTKAPTTGPSSTSSAVVTIC